MNNLETISNLSREKAKEWLEENKAKRYLEKEIPQLEEDEIFIGRICQSGQGNNFFITEVKDQLWFDSYKSKDFKSKEFYILKI